MISVPGASSLQTGDGVDGEPVGHVDVEDQHIGTELKDSRACRGDVGGLADHRELILALEEGLQRAADDGVVVGEDDRGHGGQRSLLVWDAVSE